MLKYHLKIISDASFLIYSAKISLISKILEVGKLLVTPIIFNECTRNPERFMDACVIKENKDKLYIVQPSRKSYQKKLHSGDNELLSYLEENIADIKKKKDIIIAIDDSTLRKFVNKRLSRKPAKFSRLKYTPEVIQILYELQFLTKENAIHYLELLLQTNYFRKKLTLEILKYIRG